MNTPEKKFRGVGRRKWGKWVSEIRVPGTRQRLWLGSYVNPEAAAIAHDIALYCLRETASTDNLNFPLFNILRPHIIRRRDGIVMSARSVQNATADAGMAIDAQLISSHTAKNNITDQMNYHESGKCEDFGIEDQISQPNYGYINSRTSSESDDFEMKDQALSISVEDYL